MLWQTPSTSFGSSFFIQFFDLTVVCHLVLGYYIYSIPDLISVVKYKKLSKTQTFHISRQQQH